ncbi:MAG: lytic transglycosylase domain-containing protein [Brevundimonas sp.]|uniref:lytic transglycosylase domain-containing protein n=1 Tax=Brevundimonas sp. TaxID=1871086 RepID=UPI002AB8B59B|nr:lytic transglycosylase domain-containing protein [Brevundimonas sp.]MDZ4109422.1 lytic transglycosylase domain-containing protein [Brevundimonas sp.]
MWIITLARLGLAALILALGCAGAREAAAQDRLAASTTSIDPVGDAIAEASHRFGVPQHWIRAVMRVESAGDRTAVSRAGAMGLMQIMPGTYAELRRQHGLGPDPFDVRDNIFAGAAYLRQMYDRYGAPGFLAAYNAGPGRWESHLAGRRALPAETINYLARLAPELGVSLESVAVAAPAPPPPSPFEAPLFVQISAHSAAQSPLVGQRRTDEATAPDLTPAAPTDRQFSSPNMATPRTEFAAERPPAGAADDAAITRQPAPLPAASGLFVPRTTVRDHQQ